MMYNEIHRTEQEIEADIESFIHVTEQLNLTIHDNCDENTCMACIGENDAPDPQCHYIKMDMFKSHQMNLKEKYEQAKIDIAEFEKKADEILNKCK